MTTNIEIIIIVDKAPEEPRKAEAVFLVLGDPSMNELLAN
jgi:hypothetical protein